MRNDASGFRRMRLRSSVLPPKCISATSSSALPATPAKRIDELLHENIRL